jgi:hypothetical protein
VALSLIRSPEIDSVKLGIDLQIQALEFIAVGKGQSGKNPARLESPGSGEALISTVHGLIFAADSLHYFSL